MGCVGLGLYTGPTNISAPHICKFGAEKIYPFENSNVSRFTSFCLMNATWLRVSFQLIFPLELLKSVPRARASKFATEQRCAHIATSVSILSPSRYSYDDFPSVFAANYPTIDWWTANWCADLSNCSFLYFVPYTVRSRFAVSRPAFPPCQCHPDQRWPWLGFLTTQPNPRVARVVSVLDSEGA